MVLVSKAIATNKQGNVKKGYRVIETKNGRQMYFSDSAKKKDDNKEKKEKKEKKGKKKVVSSESKEEPLIVDFE